MKATDLKNRVPELWEVEHSKAQFWHSLIGAALPFVLLCAHLLTLVVLAWTPRSETTPAGSLASWWSDTVDQFLPSINVVIAFFLAAIFVYYGRRAIAAWRRMRHLTNLAEER